MIPGEVHRHVCTEFDKFLQRYNDRGNVYRQAEQDVPKNDWKSFFAELVAWIGEVDPRTAFAGLLDILESEKKYVYQNIASELLYEANISCPLSLAEYFRRVLPLWNVSVEKVVWYASRVFGREAVLAHIRDLQAAEVSWISSKVLDSVRYHLGEHPKQAIPIAHRLKSLGVYRDGGSVSASFTEVDSDTEYCLFFKIGFSPNTDSKPRPRKFRHAILKINKKAIYLSPITNISTPSFETEERSISWSDALKLLEALRPQMADFKSDYLWVFEEMVDCAKGT